MELVKWFLMGKAVFPYALTRFAAVQALIWPEPKVGREAQSLRRCEHFACA